MMKINSDIEDVELLESYERGEWRSVSNLQYELKRYQEYALAWLEKNALVSLTLSAYDFDQLKKKASEAGVSYQTLINQLVHQFVTGQGQTKI